MNNKQTAEAARKKKNERAKEYYQENKIEIKIKRKKKSFYTFLYTIHKLFYKEQVQYHHQLQLYHF